MQLWLRRSEEATGWEGSEEGAALSPARHAVSQEFIIDGA